MSSRQSLIQFTIMCSLVECENEKIIMMSFFRPGSALTIL